MKNRLIILIVICLNFFSANSQDISGEWYGWANLNYLYNENNWMISFNIKQIGEQVEGNMGVYYMDEYITTRIVGIFDLKSKTFLITNLVIPIHFQTQPGFEKINLDIFLNCNLINSRSGTQLRGILSSKSQAQIPNINFSLYRTIETVVENKTDSIVNNEEKPAVTEKKVIITHDFEVDSDTLEIALYDGSIIDHDSVSVTYNSVTLAQGIELKETPYIINLVLSSEEPTHLLVLNADNLGSIPPNTGIMIVKDKTHRYEVNFSNNDKVSTGVIFTKGAR